jgi:hypothetical protein
MSAGIEDPLSSIGNFLRALGWPMKLASCALTGLTPPCQMREPLRRDCCLKPTTNAAGPQLGMKLRSNFIAFAGEAESRRSLR